MSPVLSGTQRDHHHLDTAENMRKGQHQQVRVVTLNVVTLTGKSREIAGVMKKSIDILCLQETKWTGEKHRGRPVTLAMDASCTTVEETGHRTA